MLLGVRNDAEHPGAALKPAKPPLNPSSRLTERQSRRIRFTAPLQDAALVRRFCDRRAGSGAASPGGRGGSLPEVTAYAEHVRPAVHSTAVHGSAGRAQYSRARVGRAPR